MIEANNLGSSPSLENTIISQAYIALQVQGFVTSLIPSLRMLDFFLDHIWVMFCIQDLIARPIHCTDVYPSIYFMPRFMASEVPIMEIANSKLLQIFTAPPVPTPPQWVICNNHSNLFHTSVCHLGPHIFQEDFCSSKGFLCLCSHLEIRNFKVSQGKENFGQNDRGIRCGVP